MEGNMNSAPYFGFPLPACLALEVKQAEDRCTRTCPTRRGAASQPKTRAPSQPIRTALSGGPKPKGIVREVLVINAGEDIGERLRSHFQDQNQSAYCGDHECIGLILSATGPIWSPTINVQGPAMSFEGKYDIISLAGFFSIPKNGQVDLSGRLKLVFPSSDCCLIGGSVVGPLIAADPVQVMVGSFIHEDE